MILYSDSASIRVEIKNIALEFNNLCEANKPVNLENKYMYLAKCYKVLQF